MFEQNTLEVLLSIPAFLQDDEPFEDARSVHFSTEALKYRLEGKSLWQTPRFSPERKKGLT